MKEDWKFQNGRFVSYSARPVTCKWEKEEIKTLANNLKSQGVEISDITQMMNANILDLKENLGIGFLVGGYINAPADKNVMEEYEKIEKFLFEYKIVYAIKNNISPADLRLHFINYGKTELVFVLTEKSGKRVTLLVKQPAVEFGKVLQEAKNLTNLKKIDKTVVAPIDYFASNGQELYVTPYMHQARCVASDLNWGMYVPEPFYRFEDFTKTQSDIVTTCMIAKLVSYYDMKKQEGICACKLGGGDFMLPKGWELKMPTLTNTYNNLHLIAAREKMHCSFEEYLNIIRDEFSRPTINENQSNLKINHRGRVHISKASIEKGIALGKKILEKRQTSVEK